MTLMQGTDQLESTRLALRRIALDDLPVFVRIHSIPEVTRYLYPGGQPRSPEWTDAWLRATLVDYERLQRGCLAVFRKADKALIGRCGLTDLALEATAHEQATRRGWFGRDNVPAGVSPTFENELSYTFDPAVWGQGYATEAACCIRNYARDVLRLPYVVSVILPANARSQQVAERAGARADGQIQVIGLTWDRYVWPISTGAEIR
jgi:RimJ/RimL family protein N-acetyltransferase